MILLSVYNVLMSKLLFKGFVKKELKLLIIVKHMIFKLKIFVQHVIKIIY